MGGLSHQRAQCCIRYLLLSTQLLSKSDWTEGCVGEWVDGRMERWTGRMDGWMGWQVGG